MTVVDALFPTPEDRREFIEQLLASRFNPLHIDAEANSPGLASVLATARKDFPAKFSEKRRNFRHGRTLLSDTLQQILVEHARRFQRISRRIDGKTGMQPHVREIELANYIEDVVAAVVGAQYVDPFLRAMTVVD